MNRSEFEFLFIHANSLAELALRRMASTLEPDRADEASGPPPLSEDERDAQAASLLAGMDISAMDAAFSWEDDKHHAEVQGALDELSSAPAEAASIAQDAPPADSGDQDLGVYLEKAYAWRSQLGARVDACMERVDERALTDILSALPAGFPPLTQSLTAEGLAQWLAVYQSGDDALNSLVVLIRSSEE